jgi:hypothetical protein
MSLIERCSNSIHPGKNFLIGLLQGKDAAPLEAGRRDTATDNAEEEDNDRRRVACPHAECRIVTVERERTDRRYRVFYNKLHVCGNWRTDWVCRNSFHEGMNGLACRIHCPAAGFMCVGGYKQVTPGVRQTASRMWERCWCLDRPFISYFN